MTTAFPTATITGYPRIGARRELKRAVEAYWSGKTDQNELAQTAQQIQQQVYRALTERGLTGDYAIPADFSFYDQILDTTRLFTALPARFESVRDERGLIDLDGYFALARGTEQLPPLELTKWFDTNYHYLVAEIGPATGFTLNTEALDDLLDAAEGVGASARPSITGPLTYLLLAKAEDGSLAGFTPLDRLADLLPLYRELLAHLASRGVKWVQFNEPALGADQTVSEAELAKLVEQTYGELTNLTDRPALLVTSPYGNLAGLLEPLTRSGVEALHLDLVSTDYDQDALARLFSGESAPLLVAGVVNGRNIWRNDLAASLATLQAVGAASVSTSTSLQHVPYDLDLETGLDQKLTSWLAFAHQKVSEISLLARGLTEGPDAIATEVEQARVALAARAQSSGVNDPCIRERTLSVTPENYERPDAQVRQQAQQDLNLPQLPTTTIGSFPQTSHIRSLRADYRKGALARDELDAHLREEIRCVIDFQERLGLDVLVHGEAERNDMVQYFAENFDGFAPTEHGWVQSYGSRCTRPSILWGDVKRSGTGTRGEAFTVPWISFAQQQTGKPVKGMLTGPVTILAWSFVRDDQPLEATATQVALALADEIADLEAAGTRIIQVDEPALRELLPLRAEDQAAYLDWSVGAFRLATSQVADSTQIHTHLCYSEFNEIFGAIDALNADVTSIEAARSRLELLADVPESFDRGIGPGLWDIHSPRVPSADEVQALLTTALEHIPARQLWVNPDCGLKTRAYKETKASIESLVAATEAVRASLTVAV